MSVIARMRESKGSMKLASELKPGDTIYDRLMGVSHTVVRVSKVGHSVRDILKVEVGKRYYLVNADTSICEGKGDV